MLDHIKGFLVMIGFAAILGAMFAAMNTPPYLKDAGILIGAGVVLIGIVVLCDHYHYKPFRKDK